MSSTTLTGPVLLKHICNFTACQDVLIVNKIELILDLILQFVGFSLQLLVLLDDDVDKGLWRSPSAKMSLPSPHPVANLD